MECKLVNGQGNVIVQLELIDTLWNVNWCTILIRKEVSKELIDTLWNVNLNAPPIFDVDEN